jgi:hypothetical protein
MLLQFYLGDIQHKTSFSVNAFYISASTFYYLSAPDFVFLIKALNAVFTKMFRVVSHFESVILLLGNPLNNS